MAENACSQRSFSRNAPARALLAIFLILMSIIGAAAQTRTLSDQPSAAHERISSDVGFDRLARIEGGGRFMGLPRV